MMDAVCGFFEIARPQRLVTNFLPFFLRSEHADYLFALQVYVYPPERGIRCGPGHEADSACNRYDKARAVVGKDIAHW